MLRDAKGKPVWKSRPYVLATLLLLIGAYLFAEGAQLVLLGGTLYYLITGATLIASGLLLWLGMRLGVWLYAAMLTGTIVWALGLVGWQPRALAPFVLPPLVLGLWFLMPWVWRGLGPPPVPIREISEPQEPATRTRRETEKEKARARVHTILVIVMLFGFADILLLSVSI